MRTTHHLNLHLAGAVLALTSLLNASIAGADNWTCADEMLSPGTYGNVKVAAGASCIIPSGVTITGNLSATNAVDLTIQGTDLGDIADCGSATVTIDGNVSVKGLTGNLKILNTCIEGNFTIKNSSDMGSLKVLSSTINGNATIKNNDASLIQFGSSDENRATDIGGNVTVKGNSVGIYMVVNNGYVDGNLTVISNFADQEIAIYDRTIAGNLIFKNNVSNDTDDKDEWDPLFINRIARNHIDGNLIFIHNAAIAPVQIDDNEIDGNLTCKKNDPIPTGIGNTAGGNSNCSD